jgi:general secretion pathway protein G
MNRHTSKKGFTLIEIIVTISIIALLAAAGVVSYASLNRNSRDAKRRADLEQVRAAIEMYKSTNDVYPPAVAFGLGNNICDPVGCSPGHTYLMNVPQDPDPAGNRRYYYNYSAATTEYTIGAALEQSVGSCPGGLNCGSGTNCTYCLGPYGQR